MVGGLAAGNYPQLQRVSGWPGGGGFSSFVANALLTRHVRGKLNSVLLRHCALCCEKLDLLKLE